MFSSSCGTFKLAASESDDCNTTGILSLIPTSPSSSTSVPTPTYTPTYTPTPTPRYSSSLADQDVLYRSPDKADIFEEDFFPLLDPPPPLNDTSTPSSYFSFFLPAYPSLPHSSTPRPPSSSSSSPSSMIATLRSADHSGFATLFPTTGIPELITHDVITAARRWSTVTGVDVTGGEGWEEGEGGGGMSGWGVDLKVVVELYVISVLIVVGLVGNVLSIVVLRKDRERRDVLFLLQALAVADGLYLAAAALRYPLKYLVNEEQYVDVQPVVFPLLKTFQTIAIWMMVLVTVDRFICVCRPIEAPRLFNSVARRRYAVAVFVVGFLYNIPRYFDSCVYRWHVPCLGMIGPRMSYRYTFATPLYHDLYIDGLYTLLLYVAPLSTLVFINCRLVRAIRFSRQPYNNGSLSSLSRSRCASSNAVHQGVVVPQGEQGLGVMARSAVLHGVAPGAGAQGLCGAGRRGGQGGSSGGSGEGGYAGGSDGSQRGCGPCTAVRLEGRQGRVGTPLGQEGVGGVISPLFRTLTVHGVPHVMAASPFGAGLACQPAPGGSDKNATVVLITIVIVFIVCESPELLIKIVSFTERNFAHGLFAPEPLHIISTVSELLMVINSFCNFAVYLIFGRRFRRILRETFRFSFRCSFRSSARPARRAGAPKTSPAPLHHHNCIHALAASATHGKNGCRL